jgi:hypothetical protein
MLIFLHQDATTNPQCCSNLLQNDVHQAIWKKRPGKLLKIQLYCMKMLVHIGKLDKGNTGNMFGPTQVHLGQKFKTYDQLKHGVLNSLHSQDKSSFAAGISNLPG